jgi:hypothetical protein
LQASSGDEKSGFARASGWCEPPCGGDRVQVLAPASGHCANGIWRSSHSSSVVVIAAVSECQAWGDGLQVDLP